MNIVNLIQGSAEWHAHRSQHFNASDAPAMMGCSPYKTRAQLIREMATGGVQEVDAATQRRFDAGHRFEELARPLAEQIIGEELYPCVGTDGKLSASFDGLTLTGDTAFEHKTLNASLRAALSDGGDNLPSHYQVQMEQQLLVSGAERVLFMASMWDADGVLIEERHCWYVSSPALRAQIVAGWEQLAADVAAYQPEASAPAAAGRAPDALPALRIELTGMVTASNLAEFKASAMATLGSINRDLQTDEQFADAEQTVKWAKGVEDKLEAAKQHALSQTASIDELFRTIDDVSAETRRVRLELDKLVKAEKERRRAEIVAAGVEQVRQHYIGINGSLGDHAMGIPAGMQHLIAGAIKGKKSLASMRDAVAAAVAQAKIDANQDADAVRANVAVLAEFADHAHLFADRVQLCASKQPEDLRNLAKARIAEHEQREQARLDAERERIRAEEAEKLEREQAAAPVASTTVQHQQAVDPVANVSPSAPVSAPESATTGKRIKLGDINSAIAPLSITAGGLAQLGIKHVAQERAAKLYDEGQLPAIYAALRHVLTNAELNYPLAA